MCFGLLIWVFVLMVFLLIGLCWFCLLGGFLCLIDYVRYLLICVFGNLGLFVWLVWLWLGRLDFGFSGLLLVNVVLAVLWLMVGLFVLVFGFVLIDCVILFCCLLLIGCFCLCFALNYCWLCIKSLVCLMFVAWCWTLDWFACNWCCVWVVYSVLILFGVI